MFDYQTIKLMHRHGDEDWAPMAREDSPEPSAATRDPERTWLRTTLFRCTRCDDVVAVEGAVDPADLGGR